MILTILHAQRDNSDLQIYKISILGDFDIPPSCTGRLISRELNVQQSSETRPGNKLFVGMYCCTLLSILELLRC